MIKRTPPSFGYGGVHFRWLSKLTARFDNRALHLVLIKSDPVESCLFGILLHGCTSSDVIAQPDGFNVAKLKRSCFLAATSLPQDQALVQSTRKIALP
jgi:hypothetical protein